MILRTTTPEIRKDPVLLARLRELTIGVENHSAMIYVLEEIDDSVVFIAMRDGRAIGWSFVRPTRQIGIFVDPVWRRIGIGTSLMKEMGPSVTAYPDDDGAVAFFEFVDMDVNVIDTRVHPGEGI